jgi:hypothetical protein
VDEQVQAAELAERLRDERLRAGPAAKVAIAPSGRDDRPAVGPQPRDDLAPDAARSTGDERSRVRRV